MIRTRISTEANISSATEASGKELNQLMSVEETWRNLCDQVESIDWQYYQCEDEYFEQIGKVRLVFFPCLLCMVVCLMFVTEKVW